MFRKFKCPYCGSMNTKFLDKGIAVKCNRSFRRYEEHGPNYGSRIAKR